MFNILSRLFPFSVFDDYGHGTVKRDDAVIKQWVKDNPNAFNEEFEKWWKAYVERTT